MNKYVSLAEAILFFSYTEESQIPWLYQSL